MALGVSFHPREVVEAKVRSLTNVDTLELRSGTDDVTLFIHTLEDATTILTAALDLVKAINARNEAERLDSVTL